MSAVMYLQHYAARSSEMMRRTKPQGRPRKDDETKMLRVNITISPAGRRRIQARAKELGMSFSAYLELAGCLYTPELLKT